MIQQGRRMELEQFLSSLSHNHELSKPDRYDLLLQARSLTFDAPAIKTTLQQMKNDGIKPGRVALRALIQYHVSCGDLEGAEQLCLSLPRYGQHGLDAYMITTMLSGWAKKGLVERAEALFKKVPELHQNCHLVTAMMIVYQEAKLFELAVQLANSINVVKQDSVMKKVLIKCMFHIPEQEVAALREWTKASSNYMGPLDWLEMGGLFVERDLEFVIQMAKDALLRFGIVNGVPELFSLIIQRSSQDRSDQLVSLVNDLISKCPQNRRGLIANPLLSLLDFAKKHDNKHIFEYVKEKHKEFQQSFSRLTHVQFVAKLNT